MIENTNPYVEVECSPSKCDSYVVVDENICAKDHGTGKIPFDPQICPLKKIPDVSFCSDPLLLLTEVG